MSNKQVIGIAVGMLVCVGIGAGLVAVAQFFKPIPETALSEPEVVKPEPRIIKDERAEYEAERLRNEVDRLRRENERLKAAQARAVAAPVETVAPNTEVVVEDTANRRGGRGRPAPTDLTPEQLADLQARRDEFAQRREQLAADRMNFLASVDTKGMTAAQRENHEKLIASLTQMNELAAALAEDPGATDLRQEMRDLAQDLGALYEAERDYLIKKAVGSQQIADQIQAIYDNTSTRGGMMLGVGGGPGGGGMGGFLGGGGNAGGGQGGRGGTQGNRGGRGGGGR